jgi:hypothetical protein
LDLLLESFQDARVSRQSAAEKRRRDAELTEEGQLLRDRVATGIVGGDIQHIGGDRPALNSNGTVSAPTTPAASLRSLDAEDSYNKRRRNNRQQDAIDGLMSSGFGAAKMQFEAKRLDFELQKHNAEMDIRRQELAMQVAARAEEHALRVKEIEIRQAESQAAALDRAACHEVALHQLKQDADFRTREAAQRHLEFQTANQNSQQAFQLKMMALQAQIDAQKK